jgi:hypothetical protein
MLKGAYAVFLVRGVHLVYLNRPPNISKGRTLIRNSSVA